MQEVKSKLKKKMSPAAAPSSSAYSAGAGAASAAPPNLNRMDSAEDEDTEDVRQVCHYVEGEKKCSVLHSE